MTVNTRRFLGLALVGTSIAFCASPALRGQVPTPTARGVVDLQRDFLVHWRTSRDFTLLVAEAMPEEHYAFKPSPAEMSFGELMVHIGSSSLFRFAQIAGVDVPVPPPSLPPTKPAILKYLRDTFDACEKLAGTMSEASLTASYKVNWEGMPTATGREILWAMFTHTAHHRGQAEVYMRVKGITPPIYRF